MKTGISEMLQLISRVVNRSTFNARKKKGLKRLKWILSRRILISHSQIFLILTMLVFFFSLKHDSKLVINVSMMDNGTDVNILSKAETRMIWLDASISLALQNSLVSPNVFSVHNHRPGIKYTLNSFLIKNYSNDVYLFAESVGQTPKKELVSVFFRRFHSMKQIEAIKEHEKISWRRFDTSLSKSQGCIPPSRGRLSHGYRHIRLIEAQSNLYMFFCSCSDYNLQKYDFKKGYNDGMHNWIVKIYRQNLAFFGVPTAINSQLSEGCEDISFFSITDKVKSKQFVLGVSKIIPHTIVRLDVQSGEKTKVSETFAHVLPSGWATQHLELGAEPLYVEKKILLRNKVVLKQNVKYLRKFSRWMLGTFTAVSRSKRRGVFWYAFLAESPYTILCRTKIGQSLFESKKYFKIRSVSRENSYMYFVISSSKIINRYKIKEQTIYDSFICSSDENNALELSSKYHMAQLEDKIILHHLEWNFVDNNGGTVFNPSVISLPKFSKYPYVAVGRIKQEKGVFKDEKLRLQKTIYFNTIVYCFMNINLRCITRNPEKIDIPFSRRSVIERMQRSLKKQSLEQIDGYNFYVGPEDGRLFWNQIDNSLYLSYGMNAVDSDHSSRNMWTVLFATVVPEFKTVSSCKCHECNHNLFQRPTELFPPFKQNKIEKNWMFFNSRHSMTVSYEIEPHTVLSVHDSGQLHLKANQSSSKLYSWIDRRTYRVNQGTNAIPVRNKWFSHHAKELNMQISHLTGNGKLSYKHILVFFEMNAPYTVVKVLDLGVLDTKLRKVHKSKRLLYISSMDLQMKNCSSKINISEPNDILLITYGVDDVKSGAIHISVNNLVQIGKGSAILN